jgi:3-carboxy-cis,cis-muconate cycloisomerase
MVAAFSDDSLLRGALAFEAALALGQAEEGLIPTNQALAIEATCAALNLDPGELAEAAAHAGTLAIPLVEQLRAAVLVTHPSAAAAVHRGASSQDLADTALMLQARTASRLVAADLDRLENALAALIDQHAETPMLG